MYQRFYNLEEMPFELTPNPKYLYLSYQHREALSNLEYGLLSAKGITVLIGEAGTGKTTLIHAMLSSSRCRHVHCVFVNNPTLTRNEFYEMLARQFALVDRAGQSKAVFLGELEALLRQRQDEGWQTALVIDEAQSLSGELLEELRLLANSETATQKLLPLILVGQPELRYRLNEIGLRQLKQRITLRCEITPFHLNDTIDYISSRVRTAGGDAAALFTRDAIALIHERSAGIPRTISVLCDNAPLTGCGLGQQPVTRAVVLEVARDFDLVPPAPSVPTATTPDFEPELPSAPLPTPVETMFVYRPPQGPPIAIAPATPRVTPQDPLLADKILKGATDFFWWSVNKVGSWLDAGDEPAGSAATRPHAAPEAHRPVDVQPSTARQMR
jgi:type II secretory pathway predicted ATPase ExeA